METAKQGFWYSEWAFVWFVACLSSGYFCGDAFILCLSCGRIQRFCDCGAAEEAG